jgi:hypothetical protein
MVVKWRLLLLFVGLRIFVGGNCYRLLIDEPFRKPQQVVGIIFNGIIAPVEIKAKPIKGT